MQISMQMSSCESLLLWLQLPGWGQKQGTGLGFRTGPTSDVTVTLGQNMTVTGGAPSPGSGRLSRHVRPLGCHTAAMSACPNDHETCPPWPSVGGFTVQRAPLPSSALCLSPPPSTLPFLPIWATSLALHFGGHRNRMSRLEGYLGASSTLPVQ